MQEQIKVPKIYTDLLNQVFEVEKKSNQLQETNSISRNVNRIKDIFENDLPFLVNGISAGLIYHNPLGERYDETRTDCEASIAGSSTENLEVVEVIRPIIRLKAGGLNHIVQKAIVVVQAKENQSN